jgi:hypothetical protein
MPLLPELLLPLRDPELLDPPMSSPKPLLLPLLLPRDPELLLDPCPLERPELLRLP